MKTLLSLFLLLALGASAATGIKISEYPNTPVLTNSELFIVAVTNVTPATNRNISYGQLRSLLSSNNFVGSFTGDGRNASNVISAAVSGVVITNSISGNAATATTATNWQGAIWNTVLNNYFLGNQAGNLTATGVGNQGDGFGALLSLTSGSYNTSFGHNSMLTGGYPTGSVAYGSFALYNGGGNYNTAVGYATMENRGAGGTESTALGASVLRYNNGTHNLGVGVEALEANTDGVYNTAVGGYDSMLVNTNGSFNTAVGRALTGNLSGSNNTTVGDLSLYYLNGDANSALGANAGVNVWSGNSNLILGAWADVPVHTNGNFQLSVGDAITGNLNTKEIGVGRYSIPGYSLAIQSNATYQGVLVASNGPAWTASGWQKAIQLQDVEALEVGGNGSLHYGIAASSGVFYIFSASAENNSGSPSYIVAINGGNIGIGGISSLASKLGVNGNMAIGTAYGALSAPANGLLVEGAVNVASSANITNGVVASKVNTTIPGFKSLGTNCVILACPDGGSFILRVDNAGTLTTVTNSGGL